MTPEQQIRAHEEWCQLRVQAAEHDRDYGYALAVDDASNGIKQFFGVEE